MTYTDVQNDGVLCSRCLSRHYRHDKGKITTTIQSRPNDQKNKFNCFAVFSRREIQVMLFHLQT